MSDDPDALVLRRFAEARRPLNDARFVAAVSAQLPAYSLRRALDAALTAVLTALVTGLTFGVLFVMLLVYRAGLVALGALGMIVGSIVLSSL